MTQGINGSSFVNSTPVKVAGLNDVFRFEDTNKDGKIDKGDKVSIWDQAKNEAKSSYTVNSIEGYQGPNITEVKTAPDEKTGQSRSFKLPSTSMDKAAAIWSAESNIVKNKDYDAKFDATRAKVEVGPEHQKNESMKQCEKINKEQTASIVAREKAKAEANGKQINQYSYVREAGSDIAGADVVKNAFDKADPSVYAKAEVKAQAAANKDQAANIGSFEHRIEAKDYGETHGEKGFIGADYTMNHLIPELEQEIATPKDSKEMHSEFEKQYTSKYF